MSDLIDDEIEADAPELDPTTVQYLRGIYDRDGKLTAETVLADAQDPASPLHDRFEWDDANAAHQYRLAQARLICRAMVRVGTQPVRAFVFVRSAGTYAPIREAMERPDWRAEVLAQFHRDAEAFRRRWQSHRIAADEYAAWVASEAAPES